MLYLFILDAWMMTKTGWVREFRFRLKRNWKEFSKFRLRLIRNQIKNLKILFWFIRTEIKFRKSGSVFLKPCSGSPLTIQFYCRDGISPHSCPTWPDPPPLAEKYIGNPNYVQGNTESLTACKSLMKGNWKTINYINNKLVNNTQYSAHRHSLCRK